MSMNKRDFALVARVLRTQHDNHIGATHLEDDGIVVDKVAYSLAEEFERKYPRFNRAKFFEAATGHREVRDG